MAYLKCETAITSVDANNAFCSSGWINSQPDYDVLLNQLEALNRFDPLQISGLVVFCMVLFVTGFGAGMVVKYLRRL